MKLRPNATLHHLDGSTANEGNDMKNPGNKTLGKKSLLSLSLAGIIMGTTATLFAAPIGAATLTQTCPTSFSLNAAGACEKTETLPFSYTTTRLTNLPGICTATRKGTCISATLPVRSGVAYIGDSGWLLGTPTAVLSQGTTTVFYPWVDYKTVLPAPDGYTQTPTGYTKTATTPPTLVEDYSSEQQLISAVSSTTTATTATSSLATAQAAYDALSLQSSKDALAGALASAKAHVAALQEKEARELANNQAITEADYHLNRATRDTTSSAANKEIADAKTAMGKLDGAPVSAVNDLNSKLAAAEKHASDLKAKEDTEKADKAAAAEASAFLDAAMKATTSSVAYSNITKAEAAINKIKEASTTSLNADVATAKGHAAELKAKEDGATAKEAANKAAAEASSFLASAMSVTTSSVANGFIAKAKAAIAKIDGVSTTSLDASVAAAEKYASELKAKEDAAAKNTGGGSTTGGSTTGGSTTGGSTTGGSTTGGSTTGGSTTASGDVVGPNGTTQNGTIQESTVAAGGRIPAGKPIKTGAVLVDPNTGNETQVTVDNETGLATVEIVNPETGIKEEVTFDPSTGQIYGPTFVPGLEDGMVGINEDGTVSIVASASAPSNGLLGGENVLPFAAAGLVVLVAMVAGGVYFAGARKLN
jgi:hypothetical protein